MPRPEFRNRKKSLSGCSFRPIVDLLEGRQLLNATSIAKPTAGEVHAEVMKADAEAAKLATQEKAEATKLAKQEKASEAKQVKELKIEEVTLAKQQKAASKRGELTPDKIRSTQVTGPDNSTPIAGVLTPQQVETAYGTNLLGSANEGQGITIGIVDEYNDPNIIADSNVYSAEYGLPIFNSTGGPKLTVIEDNDLNPTSTVKNSSTNPNSNSDTSPETSIDVQLAHAMAPMANIVLIETVNSSDADLLEGIQDAVNHGASAVSLSYGGGDSTSEESANATYLASGVVSTNAVVTVSTGDGSSPEYPATSPNVIGVGGTSLFLASAQGAYGYETAWGGYGSGGYSGGAGGGGPSTVWTAPTFQSANGVALSANRTIPDVSMVADPFTAVSVYDSWDSQDWTAYGGTSVASPMFAGVVALAQQERITDNLPVLTTAQVQNSLYTAYTNTMTYGDIFNDVTLGQNDDVSSTGKVTVTGYAAGPRYDLATGLGSPWADYMVPYLATGIDPGA